MVSQARGTTPTYAQDQFVGEKRFCDVVMKGGITSGVVYPLAVTELATKYRFKNIGGASAGAIAAGLAAAAEYARESGGFLRMAQIPDEMSESLFSLFQPQPRMRPVFHMLLAFLGKRSFVAKMRSLAWATISGYPWTVLFGVAPAVALAATSVARGDHAESFVGAFGVFVLGTAIALVVRLRRALFVDLPTHG